MSEQNDIMGTSIEQNMEPNWRTNVIHKRKEATLRGITDSLFTPGRQLGIHSYTGSGVPVPGENL